MALAGLTSGKTLVVSEQLARTPRAGPPGRTRAPCCPASAASIQLSLLARVLATSPSAKSAEKHPKSAHLPKLKGFHRAPFDPGSRVSSWLPDKDSVCGEPSANSRLRVQPSPVDLLDVSQRRSSQ